jgi:hypothetical protein
MVKKYQGIKAIRKQIVNITATTPSIFSQITAPHSKTPKTAMVKRVNIFGNTFSETNSSASILGYSQSIDSAASASLMND